MSAEGELAGFINKFAPPMQSFIRSCRSAMRARYPNAIELVYDNYNFFVIGYGPTPRPSESIFSLAAHRNGITLCFLQRGPELPDPEELLRGTGKVVRHVRLASVDDLTTPAVRGLMDAAQALAKIAMSESPGPELIIKSVSAKQRPRR